ncbi:helix-turn-helix transcriptional regulator [Nonomuraea salmonea]|uniref:helix-turn-helix domain-containing protein n=1 Tax=Nonomuraea salmonea TaxID=46181 RepID=UPI0031EF13E4
MEDLEAIGGERLGRRLRELRTESGKSLRTVAKELGISPSAVSQIERGTMRPSVSRLIAYVTAIRGAAGGGLRPARASGGRRSRARGGAGR